MPESAESLDSAPLYVAMQPIVDIARRKVFAYEALLRSHAPDFTSPLPILELAVTNKMMGRLGRRLRELALTTCPTHPLFLNIHPSEFDEGWLVRPDDPIFRHDHDVFLEITESVPLSHFQLCRKVLHEIRGKGVYLAVDDLGAGYSNLKYIADLAPEVVKIDREIVAGVVHEGRAHKLIRAIVRLCEDLGAKVVAEGVETREELDAVLSAGVHYVQGYYICRPAYPLPEVRF